MAKRKSSKDKKLRDALRGFIRARGAEYLADPNVTSIGVGHKNAGRPEAERKKGDGQISLVFSVGTKAEGSVPEAMNTRELPKTIKVDGIDVPTDVIERQFQPSYEIVEVETSHDNMKSRLDTIVPGASVSHASGTAGTLGLIVFDAETGAPCLLSNWHVLHGTFGNIGDPVVQPGPHDDNNVGGNFCGTLLRSHLGAAGDCAIAHLKDREFDQNIHNLGVTPTAIANVDLDDIVVKSGRTTGVTYGKVRRVDVMAKLNYGFPAGVKSIGCFEIAPDPDHPAASDEISMKGDSGSAWMIADGADATDVFAGLHFGGEGGSNPDDHALACYPKSVQTKLNYTLAPPDVVVLDDDESEAIGARSGYDADFLGLHAPMPTMSIGQKRDAVNFGRAQTIPYTHFSVCLSAKRRLAKFVAWNIDGSRKVQLGSQSFRTDPRIDKKYQSDNSLYSGNKLDRGHIARRADLAWGPIAEARQANRDSYFYTNIAPQHERFNQSSRGGLWGRLENLILEEAATEDIRVSVIAGPIFGDDDPEYRGVKIPRDFWKLVAYRGADKTLNAACFVLSQSTLLSDIEAFDFDPFRLYQISVSELSSRTNLGFEAYEEADITANAERLSSLSVENLGTENVRSDVREILSMSGIAI